MTLFELLLVLVLLVVIASFAKPIFDGAFASLKLQRAGDKVIAAWSELRILAIQTGQPHQFQFQPESGHYRLEPWYGYLVDPDTQQMLGNQGASYGDWEPYEAELPEEIEFYQGDSLSRENGDVAEVVSLSAGGTSGWSEPIIFFPDGSTTRASLLLQNQKDLVLRITLRPLTGVGRASEVMTMDESRQLQAR